MTLSRIFYKAGYHYTRHSAGLKNQCYDIKWDILSGMILGGTHCIFIVFQFLPLISYMLFLMCSCTKLIRNWCAHVHIEQVYQLFLRSLWLRLDHHMHILNCITILVKKLNGHGQLGSAQTHFSKKSV